MKTFTVGTKTPRKHVIKVNSKNLKELYCPNCDSYHGTYGDVYIPCNSNFCPFCGQALDWREE